MIPYFLSITNTRESLIKLRDEILVLNRAMSGKETIRYLANEFWRQTHSGNKYRQQVHRAFKTIHKKKEVRSALRMELEQMGINLTDKREDAVIGGQTTGGGDLVEYRGDYITDGDIDAGAYDRFVGVLEAHGYSVYEILTGGSDPDRKYYKVYAARSS